MIVINCSNKLDYHFNTDDDESFFAELQIELLLDKSNFLYLNNQIKGLDVIIHKDHIVSIEHIKD